MSVFIIRDSHHILNQTSASHYEHRRASRKVVNFITTLSRNWPFYCLRLLPVTLHFPNSLDLVRAKDPPPTFPKQNWGQAKRFAKELPLKLWEQEEPTTTQVLWYINIIHQLGNWQKKIYFLYRQQNNANNCASLCGRELVSGVHAPHTFVNCAVAYG